MVQTVTIYHYLDNYSIEGISFIRLKYHRFLFGAAEIKLAIIDDQIS